MEGIKGGGRVGISEEDVVVSDGMQCINHPHRKNPGGICAFCLQEKLGKLVSSSFPLSIIPTASSSPSSPSSPSFRSNTTLPTSSPSLPPKNNATISNNYNHNHNHNHNMRYRLPFLLPKKKKKKKPSSMNPSSSSSSSDVVLKRSKSTATPRRIHFLDDNNAEDDNFSPRKRNGFWSFLYLSSSSTTKPSPSCSKKLETKSFRESNTSPRISSVKPRVGSSLGRKNDIVFEEEEEEEEEESGCGSLEQRRVSRSRSVGCGGGSRSFSGDFFERISTGFGDCTLRRVESQREGGNNKVGVAAAVGNIQNCMKERVRCGGIFGGFMMMTSSSAASSSSSSSYWVSSDGVNDGRGARSSGSWGWALASPIRAFTKNSSKDHNKRGTASQKNTTPNLSAVPSLLTVRS